MPDVATIYRRYLVHSTLMLLLQPWTYIRTWSVLTASSYDRFEIYEENSSFNFFIASAIQQATTEHNKLKNLPVLINNSF